MLLAFVRVLDLRNNCFGLWPWQVFYVKRGAFDPTSSAVIKRRFFLPTPIATDNFIIRVESGTNPLVFKFDIIGMDPVKKYSVDPMLTPMTYTDCKSSVLFYHSLVLLKLSVTMLRVALMLSLVKM